MSVATPISPHHYIAVAGVMGSGKTTVSTLLAQKLGYRLLEEKVNENVFLPLFYQDTKRWALHAQLFYLREKIAQLRRIQSLLTETHVVQDSPIYQDYLTYAKAQKILGNMDPHEFALYEKFFRALHLDLPVPDLIIQLETSTDALSGRIRKRARDYEKTVDVPYLELLSQLQREWISEHPQLNVLVIETDVVDLSVNLDHQENFIEKVQQRLEIISAVPQTSSVL